MKKRIFIEAHYLEIGGAEISLIGLLSAIDYSRYEVDLFLYSHQGELMKLIPPQVNLLPEIPEYTQIENPLRMALFSRYWRQGLARLKAKWKMRGLAKKYGINDSASIYHVLDKELMPTLPDLNHLGTYDLAINFIALMGHIPSKVSAKKTITWIHTDPRAVNVIPEIEHDAWANYEHIASISPAVTESFVSLFQDLAPKIIEIENILSPHFVRSRAEEFDVELEGDVKLLSIGRFCEAKNYDNVPDIVRRMVEGGLKNLKWYIIGYGGDEALIRKKIAEAGMEEHVILLGKKDNPYPYIKACDIYVQPSRYEGKSVTVREAQMLCKPVAVTNYPTASSQVRDGIDGVIVPLDNEGCAQALAEFISNKSLQQKIISNLKTLDFGNETEVEKIYNLID